MSIPTESYEDIFQKYSSALEWMEEIGVSFGPGRTQHYLKVMKYWKDEYKTATKEKVKKEFPDFINSMFEIHDFIDIYNALYSVPRSQLTNIVAKLQKGVNGPINANDETPSSTTARNFLFEATVAAKAHQPTKGVEAILDAKSDTGIRIDKKKLWVECKRVTTIDKIEANMKKASNQLESIINRQNGSGHRGIVALEVTKLINTKGGILVIDNDLQLLAYVEVMMDKFIEEYSEIWQRLYKRKNKKIIGTIIRFAFMSSSEARNIPIHTSQWAMNPRREISNSDKNIQKLLVSSLRDTL